ncbi:MAG: hypothetical protein ACOX0O_12700 [Candidatus Methanoculleus thermohydrogenotrophicum]|jgi:ATP-dependent DNA helicase RecG
MINVLNAASLPLPEIISTPLGFTLTMRKDPFTEEYLQELGLNKRQVAAISFLRVHGTITNSQYQELKRRRRKDRGERFKRPCQEAHR